MPNKIKPTAEREAVISGLRDLADFLEANPEVPIDSSPSFQYSATAYAASEEQARERVDEVAELLGTEPGRPWDGANYQARRTFGQVEYVAVATPRKKLQQHGEQPVGV